MRDTILVTTTCCTSRLFSDHILNPNPFPNHPVTGGTPITFFATASILAPCPEGHLLKRIHFHLFASSDCTKFNSSHRLTHPSDSVHHTLCDRQYVKVFVGATFPSTSSSSGRRSTPPPAPRRKYPTVPTMSLCAPHAASPDALLHPFASPCKCQ